MSATDWTKPGMLRAQAQVRGDSTAIVFEDRRTSYRELDARATRVANGLLALGLGRGGRTAALDFNSDRYFEVYFGTTRAGGAMVGINARLAPPEVAYILNDAGVEVLFVGEEHYALIEGIVAELPTVRHIVALHGGHPRWPDFAAWRDAQSSVDPQVSVTEDDDCIQLYTSGTTGRPKGACHTHGTWHRFSAACRAAGWADLTDASVMLVCMPVFHVAGFNQTCLTLSCGGRVVILRKVEPGEILLTIDRERVTDTLFVPAMILALVSDPRIAQLDVSSLRNVCYGAAPIAEDLLDRARAQFNCGFIHLYGLTECLGGATYLPAEMHDPALGKLRSCGRAYQGLDLRVVDTEGNDAPVGSVGEIIVRCSWTMRGYWRKPEATTEAVRDGWLFTGDAGYLDADGYLYIFDRVKDMIVSGGENVYPAEVENALFGHPSIADVAVIGVPDDKWGEAVKAIVVLKPGATLDEQEMIAFARKRIAGYKLPKSIETIAALPRNASGKVLRRELREKYWQGQQRRVH